MVSLLSTRVVIPLSKLGFRGGFAPVSWFCSSLAEAVSLPTGWGFVSSFSSRPSLHRLPCPLTTTHPYLHPKSLRTPPHQLGRALVFLHHRSIKHTATHPHLTTKTPPPFPPPLSLVVFVSNQHSHKPDRRQIDDLLHVLLIHHRCCSAGTVATSLLTRALSPDLRPPPEPPPLPQALPFNSTETQPIADLTWDRPAPKPPWLLSDSSPLATGLRFMFYVFKFDEGPYLPWVLLCPIWFVLFAICSVGLCLSIDCFKVALMVFDKMPLHLEIFGTGLLQPDTIKTTTNFSFLSASQMNSTHEMNLANIETIYSRNVLAKVKKMIRNWMGLKTEGPLAIVHVWMKLVWLVEFLCRLVYHELLTVKRCKVRVRVLINLLLFYDGQVTSMLVFEVDQSETCYSRFVLALVQKMIRNWIDSKTVVSPSHLAPNNVWKKLAFVIGLDVWFDEVLLWPKLLCNDPINLDVQNTRITSKVWLRNALTADYLSCNLFNFIY